jgi:hypothetical protein
MHNPVNLLIMRDLINPRFGPEALLELILRQRPGLTLRGSQHNRLRLRHPAEKDGAAAAQAEGRALGRRVMITKVGVLALTLAASAPAFARSDPPYSCRLLYDEQKKCAFGSCDKRVIERLTKECLRDGGRP